jgi:hypothetical protein
VWQLCIGYRAFMGDTTGRASICKEWDVLLETVQGVMDGGEFWIDGAGTELAF